MTTFNTRTTSGRMFMALILSVGISACGAREPKSVGLTGIVYNYSDEGYSWVKVNGKTAGTGLKKVAPGHVSGGGYMCCFDLPLGATEVEVFLQPSKTEGFTTTATIEKWWPDLAHYGVVHILPGRKVMMEIRSVETWPRKDLLDAQLKALNIPFEYNYTSPMNVGPLQRTDGVS